MGLDPRIPGSHSEPKADVQPLSHPGVPIQSLINGHLDYFQYLTITHRDARFLKQLRVSECMHACVFRHMNIHLWELLDQTWFTFSALVDIIREFSKDSGPSKVWEIRCSTFLQHLIFPDYFVTATLVGMWLYFVLISYWISVMINEVAFSHTIMGNLALLFHKIFQVFCLATMLQDLLSSYWFVRILIVHESAVVCRAIYVFWSIIDIMNIFSQSGGVYLHSFSDVFWWMTISYIMIQYICLSFIHI